MIVVDSLANGAMTRSLRAAIQRVTDRPVRFLVNTHSHADHVYTNHLFPEAVAVSTRLGRAATKANQAAQAKHDALFARLFPDVDLAGGRYTLQDIGFSGRISFYQGEREVRVLELGVGHSESDVVVHLPAEKIVFCGDLFLNPMAPIPGEGHVSQTIANYKTIEGLEASIYVAGHGYPGTLADVRAQRIQLEAAFEHAKECFYRGMSYDAAVQAGVGEGVPSESARLILLASYWELMGRRPESSDLVSRNHITILRGIAAEAKKRVAEDRPMP